MASLGTILIDGDPANQTTNFTTYSAGDYVNLDEGIAGADGTEEGDDQNANGDKYLYLTLGAFPGDLGTLDTISVNVRDRVTGAQTNNRDVFVRLETDAATPTALTSELTLHNDISHTTLANTTPQALTISGTPSLAQLNSAVVRIRLNVAKNKGGDTNGYRVDTLEFTGTYTEAAAAALQIFVIS